MWDQPDLEKEEAETARLAGKSTRADASKNKREKLTHE